MRTRAGALIGRAAELAAATSGPACFLVGEPGVGKSRLLAEVAQHSADAGLVTRGRASAIGPVSPLRPFAEALAAVQRQGLLPDDDLGGYRPLLARVLPQLAGPSQLGLDEATPLVAVAEAVLRVLTAIGRQTGGCLLVLEDLHDADPDSLAVLDYLLDNTAGSPVQLRGALRDQASDALDLLVAAERRGAVELLPIHPLDRANTELLVANCLAVDRPSAQLTELAWQNSGGNPLVVEELLYDLAGSGQPGERFQLPADPVLAPPPSMLQLLGNRICRLPELAQRLVGTAAVYGEEFPLAATQAALGAREDEFLAALHDAVAGQLIVAERPGWYRFHHPLTHVAVLELTGPAEYRRTAARLAEAVLAEDPERTGTTCRTAARLLVDAGQPARAGELSARAGKLALDSGAIEWAVADLSEAFRLQPPREQSAELIGELVRALTVNGQLDRAQHLVNSLPSPGDGPDRRWRALTHLDLADSYHSSGRPEQARPQLAQARSLLAEAADELIRIRCDVVAARLATELTGGSPAAERLARSAARAAERLARMSPDPAERDRAADAACRAWGLLLELRGTLDPGAAARYRARIRALVDRHALPRWKHFDRGASTQQQWMADGDDLPLRALRDQHRDAGRVGQVLYLDILLWLHQAMVGEGSLAHVIAGLADCAEQGRRLGFPAFVQAAVAHLALAAGFRADRAELTGLLARYEIAGPHPGLAQDLGMAWACCLALEGRDDEALATLQDLARRGFIGPHWNSFPLGLLLLLDAVAGASRQEEIAEAFATSGLWRWTRQFLHWAAAVHAGRRGDQDEAQRHAELAATEAEIYPIARHLAARLVAPAAYADGWGNPIEDLRTAEAWFHDQGVAAAARTCRNVLRSLGVPVQQRRDGTAAMPAELRAAGITVREYEVGLLVRDHLGNREIGQRLHISPRTVEKHLAALRSKLDLPDRRALINRLADLG